MKNRARNPRLKGTRVNPLKLDPTRTTMLRRQAIADVRRRFARLILALDELIVRQDSFGLKERKHTNPFLVNAFCPTGPGGGVDPSCDRESSVRDYTTDRFQQVNGGLRSGVLEKHDQRIVKDIDAFLESAPKRVGATIRSFNADPETFARIESQIRSGEYSDKAYLSTRKSPAITDRAAFVQKIGSSGQVVFKVTGKSGVDVSKHSLNPGEGEVLYPRGTKFKVTKFEKLSSGTLLAELTENAMATNERWEFKSSPEQLAAFQEWLKRQLKWYVVGMTEDQLWARYVQEGFRKGAGRAFDDLRSKRGPTFRSDDFLQGERRQFLSSSFRRPETVEKVKILASRTFEELNNVGEEIKLKLGRVLTDGLVQGKNPRDIAREMRDKLAMPMRRAETIARTEIIRAHAEGQLSAMEDLGVDEVGVMVEWSTAGDDRVCEACAPMEGVVLKLEEATGMIPRHPNAVFAGSTFVSYGECLESVRAEYDGPSIMLTAAGGGKHRTAIGPNHPVLTSRGLVNGTDLREGDKILYDLRNDGVGVSTVDFEEIPTHEDVFETILSVCGTAGVSASSSDLHGDRVFCKGEVEAVTPARGLLKKRDLGGVEKLLELALAGADTDPQCVASPRAGFDGCWGVLLPSTSGVSGTHSWVPADDHFVWLRIEKIETGRFVGPAFDYTAESSLYCNDGFVVKNCRCSFIPANVGESRKEQVRGKTKIERQIDLSARIAGDTFDEGNPIAAYRPRAMVTPTKNAFCPTGPGGGQDNSCSPVGQFAAEEKASFANETDDPDLIKLYETIASEAPWSGLTLERDQQGLSKEFFKGTVFGLRVKTEVPNEDSLSGYDDETSLTLKGIRAVPMSAFEDASEKTGYTSKSDEEKTNRIAEQIRENGWISPLIVVKDAKGFFILEGSHRYEALKRLGVKTIPAKVLIDHSEGPVENAFCPTGPGGGVDSTCGREGDASAIHDYTEESDDVNIPLREGGVESLTGRSKEIFDRIQPLAQRKLAEPTTVYRGVQLPGDLEDQLVEGKVVKFDGLTSTSTDLEEAKVFGRRGVMLKIRAKTGVVVGSDAAKYSAGQKEIIQAHGTSYRVVKEHEHDLKGHRRMIELEEI